MGSFAELYVEKETQLIENKMGELNEHMNVVFRESGFMKEDFNSYNGEYYITLSAPVKSGDIMYATYNYFNDLSWEDVGYDVKEP